MGLLFPLRSADLSLLSCLVLLALLNPSSSTGRVVKLLATWLAVYTGPQHAWEAAIRGDEGKQKAHSGGKGLADSPTLELWLVFLAGAAVLACMLLLLSQGWLLFEFRLYAGTLGLAAAFFTTAKCSTHVLPGRMPWFLGTVIIFVLVPAYFFTAYARGVHTVLEICMIVQSSQLMWFSKLSNALVLGLTFYAMQHFLPDIAHTSFSGGDSAMGSAVPLGISKEAVVVSLVLTLLLHFDRTHVQDSADDRPYFSRACTAYLLVLMGVFCETTYFHSAKQSAGALSMCVSPAVYGVIVVQACARGEFVHLWRYSIRQHGKVSKH